MKKIIYVDMDGVISNFDKDGNQTWGVTTAPNIKE